jgi:hypothetical protein
MMERAENSVDFSFESDAGALDEIERLTAEHWADLLFNREALAALKRDGLALDGLHLGGQSPYRFRAGENGTLIVTARGERADTLIDLWRLHFLRLIKPRNLAA